MIVVDGSAIFAVLLAEDGAEACRAALPSDRLVMSAGSYAEALIVAAGKDIPDLVRDFLAELHVEVLPLTADRARAAADAYRRWGKGFNPARLNLADSFAYALAKELDAPLLFAGNDFALTDIRSAFA